MQCFLLDIKSCDVNGSDLRFAQFVASFWCVTSDQHRSVDCRTYPIIDDFGLSVSHSLFLAFYKLVQQTEEHDAEVETLKASQ